MSHAPRLRTPTSRSRNRLSTFDNSRLGGVRTRSDQIEALLKLTQPGRYRRERRAAPTSIVETLLSRKNLLARRSPLARDNDSYYVSPEAIEKLEMAPSLSPELTIREAPADDPLNPTTATNPYNLLLSDRLSQKADDFFEVGMAYFRTGDWQRAGNYFELDKKVHGASPRPYLATTLVAFEQRNMNMAGVNLRLAFQKFETLEDMKLDIDSFYDDRRAFERAIGAARIIVTRTPDDAGANLFLGYLGWLDDDLSVARTAISTAARQMSDARTAPHVEEFARMIGASVAPAAR